MATTVMFRDERLDMYVGHLRLLNEDIRGLAFWNRRTNLLLNGPSISWRMVPYL